MAAVADDRRDVPRHRVSVTRATVRGVAQAPCEAVLHDLSIYGCRLESIERHAADEHVWLRLNGGMPISARVVWSTDDIFGCRFDAPIARATLRALTLPRI